MRFFFAVFFCLVLFSCSQTSKDKKRSIDSSKNIVSQNEELTSSHNEKLETEDYSPNDILEKKKNLETVDSSLNSKKNNEWDFCDCISKKDSINSLLANVTDIDLDDVLSFSEIVDKKCKGFFEYDVSNVNQRKKHKKKVADCINNKH